MPREPGVYDEFVFIDQSEFGERQGEFHASDEEAVAGPAGHCLELLNGVQQVAAHEFSAGGSYANVAGPGQTGGSEYKSYMFSLRARVGF